MKKTIPLSLLFAVAIVFINPVKAQDAEKELLSFTKKYEDAFNKKDKKVLKEMFTTDAVRTAPDGTVTNGSEAIMALYTEYFKDNVTIVIVQDKVATENGNTIATGTFQVTGTSATGEKVDRKGGYNNTVVKEKGNWKITNQVLTQL